MGVPLDLTDERFGKLIAKEVFQFRSPSGRSYRKWKCACDCGGEIEVKAESLRFGHTTSCGCAYQDAANKKSFGGVVQSEEYKILSQIKKRCTPTTKASKNYGSRGIDVCDRWLEVGIDGINNFIEDMGVRPSPQHTIERVDVNKGYSPENCIWTDDLSLQKFNQRPKKSRYGIPGIRDSGDGYGFVATITKNYKRHYLGFFKDLKDAAKARRDAEIEYYGFNLDWEMPE